MGETETVRQIECRQARLAYLFYLGNLSFLPCVGFLLLIGLWRTAQDQSQFVREHIHQTIIASVVAGILLAMVSGIIVLVGGFSTPWTWVILISYFTLCHSLLLLLGVLGFTRALNGRPFRFFTVSSWRN